MPINKTNLIRLAAAAVLFGASGAVLAFPCGVGYVDGTETEQPDYAPLIDDDGLSYECQDGPAGDKNDWNGFSSSDIYFGVTGWEKIDKYDVESGVGGGIIEISNFTATDPSDGLPYAGNWAFNFDGNIWNKYSDLMIVLKDGGRPTNNGTVYWTAYEVAYPDDSGDFSMPSDGLSHISLYGVLCKGDECDTLPPDEIPIPTPIALLGLGTLLLAWRGRRPLS